MADVAITDLPAASALTGPEELEFVQGGASKRGSVDLITARVAESSPINARANSLAPVEGVLIQGGRIIPSNTSASIVDGASFFLKLKMGATASGQTFISALAGASVSENRFLVGRDSSSDNLKIYVTDTTGAVYTETFDNQFTNNLDKFIVLSGSIDSTGVKLYIDGSLLVASSSTGVWGSNFTADIWCVGGYYHASSSQVQNVLYTQAGVFNYAIPADSETAPIGILQRYQRNEWVTAADKHSFFQTYISDFSGGFVGQNVWNLGAADSHSVVDTDADGAGAPPTDDWGKVVHTTNGRVQILSNNSITLNAGLDLPRVAKRYKISIDLFLPSGHRWLTNPSDFVVIIGTSQATFPAPTEGLGTYSTEITTPDSGFNDVRFGANASVTGSFVTYFKNIKIEQLGAVLNLTANQGLGRQIHDGSANKNHARINGAYTWLHKHQHTALIANNVTTAAGSRTILNDGSAGMIPANARLVNGFLIRNTGANSITATIQVATTAGGSYTDVTASFTIAAGAQRWIAMSADVLWPSSTAALFWAISSAGAISTVNILATIQRTEP